MSRRIRRFLVVAASLVLPFAALAQAATTPQETVEQDAFSGASTDPSASPVPASFPERWVVTDTVYSEGTENTFCTTVISVVNRTSSPVDVEVEWLDVAGGQQALRPHGIPVGSHKGFVPNGGITSGPFQESNNAGISPLYIGFAKVYADDPRIAVSAYMPCRDAISGNLVSIVEVAAFPVGQTLDVFIAEGTGRGVPPLPGVSTPQVPEARR